MPSFMAMGSLLCQFFVDNQMVNDSLDCSHRSYGHGAKNKNKKYDVLAEIVRK